MKKKLLAIITFILLISVFFSGCEEPRDKNRAPCSGDFITFDYAPVDLGDNLSHIKPMGLISSSAGHVTPTDHIYFITPDWVSDCIIACDVFSPADGTVTSIQKMTSQLGAATEIEYDYRVVIQHTCTISSIYIHMDELSDKILKEAPNSLAEVSVQIPVSAGELVGRWRGQLDYSVVDYDVTLPGFVDPDRYSFEDFKVHCVDPFGYFNEPVRSQMVEKNLRTTEPIGGKIDYDVNGRLIGTWFKQDPVDDILWEYNCLSIIYDFLDPSFIVISFGDYYDGDADYFGVVGNSPDPAEIGVEEGIVKYELVSFWYVDESGSWWDEQTLIYDPVAQLQETIDGVVLFQLTADRTLKVETFPNKTAEEVNDFTGGALIYER